MSRRLLGLLCCILLTPVVRAADWPMARHDARRGDASPQELADRLYLQWVYELPPLKPAWPDQPKLQFDAAYAPIVLGKTLFVGSSRTDRLLALDTETGAEKWRFQADGPIRFAPAAWEGRLYVVADDGFLYCLDATHGELLWRFRGGPNDRRVLGNERLISVWPARGAPVVADGTVYFAAGIWPFMGIFLHALDARTGEVVWTNDGDGSLYMAQPHNADAFAGVAPQGALVVAGARLLVPGGRSVPACYDRATGKMLYYRLAENSHCGGGADVSAAPGFFVNGGEAFAVAGGEHLGPLAEPAVLADDTAYTWSAGKLCAYDLRTFGRTTEMVDRKGKTVQRLVWPPERSASCELPGVESLIKAGSRLYAGMANRVVGIDLPLPQGGSAVTWETPVEGTVVRLLAADDRLFAVTREGKLCCFGRREVKTQRHSLSTTPPHAHDEWTARVHRLLGLTQVLDGYCIVWGAGSGRLVSELAQQSRLRLVVIEANARKAEMLRHELEARGIWAGQVEVHVGEPRTFALPPYLATLMVSEDLEAAGADTGVEFLSKLYASLRPYGGVACLPLHPGYRPAVLQRIAAAHLVNAQARDMGEWLFLSREGALPGSANWTNEHADPANTRVSRDQLVKAPLGLLWFGGTSHEGILPRHGHGPQPQVIDGRLIIEGVDLLRALDIYTGRLLWEVVLPGIGKSYNITKHQPGANATGGNYVSTSDGLYVLQGESCLQLDPATGRQLGAFRLPQLAGATPLRWDYVSVVGDCLVGGGDLPGAAAGRDDTPASSKYLVALDRRTGRNLWSVAARVGFRHNSICLGGDRLYCIDRHSDEQLGRLRRRGEEPEASARLRAFDLHTGREIWNSETDIFGTWLSYSTRHDVLVEAGRMARDTLRDEPRGMRVYRAATGAVLWHSKNYAGPAMLHGDFILADQRACQLLTGAPVLRPDPLTEKPSEWTWARSYGCNTPAASEHLLTFRSGAAGYYDLARDGGTGNFGGFRSSCTNNLIVAGGVLTAPDYTRTCTCTYQNQTSVGLVPMPEAEMWTSFTTAPVKGTIRHVGINLGAPGNRRADDGVLWVNYPNAGNPAPLLAVRTTPAKPDWFRHDASRYDGDGLRWVAASGAEGLTALSVTLVQEPDPERTYTVRLHFAEPELLTAGQRVFDVALQGRAVLRNFDIVREAGAAHRTVVKEFEGVRVKKDLTVTLTAGTAATGKQPVLCGIEIEAEGW